MRRIAVLCLLAACGPAVKNGGGGGGIARSGQPGTRPGEEIPAGGEPMHGTVVEAPEPGKPAPHATVGGRRRGMPHFAQIMAVVVDQAGTMAVSRDALGSVRIWPTLDGTKEPQEVPVQSPEAMAIAKRSDGSLAAMIDGTGLATLIRFDADGLVRATATLSPDVPLSGVVVLPGGERVVAVRADQRISLLDVNGTELSRLSVRGGRVVALHAAGDKLIAVVRRVVDDTASFELRRLAISDDNLAWSGDAHALADPVASLPHIASALSPDGSLFAYMGGPPEAAQLKIVRADSGAKIKLDGDVTTTFPATTMVGFTDNDTVEMAATNAAAWRVEISGANGVAISSALGSGTSAPAFASHLRVVGYQAALALRTDDGDVEYLGHRELSPTTGAMAPDGSSAAWVTSSGAIVVQRFDGSDDVRIKGANEWYGTVAIVDDDHVLAGRSNGLITLYDSHTGVELGSMVGASSTPFFMYEASTKLIGVLRDTGVVWVIPLDAKAAKPFGAAIAVGDGAQSFSLLDPELTKGGGVLLTFDPQLTARRYTMDELKDGVTASEMKKKRVNLGVSAWYFDRVGRHYVVNGINVEIRENENLIASIATTNGAAGIFPAPSGKAVLVSDGNGIGPIRAYDAKGKELWASSAIKSAFAASWSEDGSRLIVFGQGGGAVMDAKTGHALIGATGWAFGISPEVPTAFPPGVEPQFDF